MSGIYLGDRLNKVVDLAKGAETVADIGCDHGKVAVTLALNGADVLAVDISKDSLEKAKILAQQYNVKNKMHFYCSGGLLDVPQGTECIIIAGMGERLIIDILEEGKDISKSTRNLVLLPMDSVTLLREYLAKSGYAINEEVLSFDEGRLYTIIRANYKKPYKLTLIEKIIGPKIIENKDILIDKLIENELKKKNIRLNGLNSAKNPDNVEIDNTKSEIAEINELAKELGI